MTGRLTALRRRAPVRMRHTRRGVSERHLPGMISWVRRRTDPDELLTVLIAAVWAYAGWSTWHDLIGKPRDAPDLRIPGEVRAVLWWGFAVAAVLSLRLPRGCWLRRWAAIGLAVMPTIRIGSYLVSWASSWDWLDALLPDDVITGDPRGWGSIWLYVGLDLLVMCLWLAPWDWSYLDRPTRRRGRMQAPVRGGAE